jgi:hypothetical protein
VLSGQPIDDAELDATRLKRPDLVAAQGPPWRAASAGYPVVAAARENAALARRLKGAARHPGAGVARYRVR